MHSKIKVISLFSGAGGFDIGFESTKKFQTVAVVESNQVYIDTLRNNQGLKLNGKTHFLSKSKILNLDVKNISGTELLDKSGINSKKDVFVIIGGPPCQSFSVIGKRLGLRDTRGMMIFEFVRLIKECKPQYFVFENVPGMVNQWGGRVIRKLTKAFNDINYKMCSNILNAADYGAYTRRKRFIMIGTCLNNINPTVPIQTNVYLKSKFQQKYFLMSPWLKVKDILEDLPLPNTEDKCGLTHHIATNHTEAVRNRFSNLEYGQRDYIRKRTRLDPELPSLSLMAGGEGGYVYHIHYKYPRELTSRECARIQGFPDEYVFAGKPLDVAKQIVNAVPVQLSTAIAKQIYKMVQQSKPSKKPTTKGNDLPESVHGKAG